MKLNRKVVSNTPGKKINWQILLFIYYLYGYLENENFVLHGFMFPKMVIFVIIWVFCYACLI